MKTSINIKSFLLFAIMALSVTPMFGQAGQGPGGPGQRRQYTEEDVKDRVKRQAQALEMTEEQEKKITDFEVEQFKKMQVERQKNQGDWEKMRESMTKNRELRDKKYEEVLTPEQFKKYKVQQEERRKQMQERRQQNPNQPGGRGGQNQGDRPQRGRG